MFFALLHLGRRFLIVAQSHLLRFWSIVFLPFSICRGRFRFSSFCLETMKMLVLDKSHLIQLMLLLAFTVGVSVSAVFSYWVIVVAIIIVFIVILISGKSSRPFFKGDENSKVRAVIQPSSNKSKSSDSNKSMPSLTSEISNLSKPSHMSKDIRWEAIRLVEMQQGTLGLQHFNLKKKLGSGSTGRVYLAELIGTKCLFAIKAMDNDFLSRTKRIRRAQTEKEILGMLDHPFLPTLYCHFTSDNLSFLVMEYCPGGDLHVLRQRQPGRCFIQVAARFYAAEVLLALEYLHMLGVVYRDLKPENIMVQEDGHIMLVDFDLSLRCDVNPILLLSSPVIGTRKRLCVSCSCVSCFTPRRLPAARSKSKSKSPSMMKSEAADQLRPLLVAEPITCRSNSFVGTHEYIAPEIIKGEGYGSAVDWWTFGIFLYELLYGKTPFKGVDDEGTLANVELQSLGFPDSPLVSQQARDLIMALLVKDPENRLGSKRGAADVKQHPFFKGLNWALIRCMVPPKPPLV